MASKKKKIEFYQVDIRKMDGQKHTATFESIILPTVGKEVSIKDKTLELKIFRNSDDLVIGILETSRKSNVPPKKNHQEKKLSKIGLTKDEGLAYANVFLYDMKRKILLYEVNKFGCFIDHFISFIYLAYKDTDSFKDFKIKVEAILTEDEYRRIVNMKFHKSVEIQLAYPDKIMEEFEHRNGALAKVCEAAKDVHSGVFAKFDVGSKKKFTGLVNKSMKELIDDLNHVIQTKSGGYVKKVIVSGYVEDMRKIQHIDLIADRYLKEINLEEPRENNDLLEKQRVKEIAELYEKCAGDMDAIFSSK